MKTLQSYFKFVGSLHANCKDSTITKVQVSIEKKILALEEKLTKQEGLGNVKESVEVRVHAHDLLGNQHTLDELVQRGEDFRTYLIVVKILVKNIHSVIDSSKTIGNISISDSFVFGQNHFINVTRDIPYFDFFEARREHSFQVFDMKELYAQNVLGTRLAKKCGNLDIYIPLIEGLDRNRIDFPLVRTEASWFEKGLKFFSDKLGNFILFFADVQSAGFLKNLDSAWVIFTLKENLFFPKIAQPLFCIRFSGDAHMNIHLNLRQKIVESGLIPKIEDLKELPESLLTSITLQSQNLVKLINIQAGVSFIETSETTNDEEFVKFNTQLQKLKVLSHDENSVVEDADVSRMLGAVSKTTIESRETKIEVALGESSTSTQLTEDLGAGKSDPVEKINLFLIVGPPFSGKRAFAQSVWEHRAKFPGEEGVSNMMVTYDDLELINLTIDEYEQKIIQPILEEDEDERLQPGDWMVIIIPHTISHLELYQRLYARPEFEIRACVCKLNLNDLYTKNQTAIKHLRRYLEEGYTNACFTDYDGMDSNVYSSRINILEAAFPHIKFIEVFQNRLLWMRLNQVFTLPKLVKVRQSIARKYNRSSYEFGEEFIRLDYKIPILEEELKRFKEVIIDLEGALLNPETEAEPEDEEILEERRKKIKFKVQDELFDEVRAVKAVMRGLIAKRDQGKTLPFITRIKGVFRFEGKLEKGPYSLYLSPYGFYFNELKVLTKVETVEKGGLTLIKPTYDDFEMANFGFYIYGHNLDSKIIQKWFNKNLLPKVDMRRSLKLTDLTVEMRKNMELENRDWGLDGGEFFDGSFFRDVMGQILKGHPKAQALYEKYLGSENEKIAAHNEYVKENEKLRRKFYLIY